MSARASVTRLRGRPVSVELLLFVVCLVVLYGRLAPELVADWARSENYSHGFAVPLLAGWIVWRRRERLREGASSPCFAGVGLLCLGLAQYLIGAAAAEFFLQRSSLIPWLGGWTLLVWGRRRARLLAFPIAYLAFMIPPPALVWSEVALPLQFAASRLAASLLTWAGLPVGCQGNVLQVGSCSLEVATACSGLRSLVSLLALAALLAEGSLVPGRRLQGWLGKLTLVAVSIPIAVGTNALRVTVAGFAAHYGGEALVDRLHTFSGFAMFACALVLLATLKELLAWSESARRSR
jgi:exosortase